MRYRPGWLVFGFVAVASPSVLVVAQAPQNPASTTARRPPAPSWMAPLTADGAPDLEGVWADTSATPLERPAALGNKAALSPDEIGQMKDRAERLLKDPSSGFLAGDNFFVALVTGQDRVENPNSTDDATAMVARYIDGRTSLIVDPPNGRIPPLTPGGAQRVARAPATLGLAWQPGQQASTVRRTQTRYADGPADLTNLLRCITYGVPNVAINPNYTGLYQIVQGPGYVVLINEANHDTRVIPTDGRAHLQRGLRQWQGDSRGRWEGRTLVVDTTNFSPKSYFRGSTDGLHLVERLTRTGPDAIEYAMTIDDPTTWTQPWTAIVHLRRTTDHVYEFACHEGNYEVMRGMLGGIRAEEREGRSLR
jgi:hypothetical protein